MRQDTARALDHLFVFVSGEDRARHMMEAAGLRVNYARAHPGQGTANLCACLDDIVIELLWLDGSALSAESERISLGLRGRGNGSPLGLAWRGTAPDGCDAYAAPFLPEGVTLPVMRESLDPAMPFVFGAPGGVPPVERDPALVGSRQMPRLARLGSLDIALDDDAAVSLVARAFPAIGVRRGDPRLRMSLVRPDGTAGRDIDWPLDAPPDPRAYSPGGRRRSRVIGKARCGVSFAGA